MRLCAFSEFVPSYIWFFAKLSVLLFVYHLAEGNAAADARGSKMMQFSLEIHVADGVSRASLLQQSGIAPGAGYARLAVTLFVIVVVYTALSIVLDTRREISLAARLPFR